MKNFFLHNREAALAVIVVALALLIGLRAPVFLTPSNLLDVLTDSSILAILVMGQMVVLLTKGIDLSVAYALWGGFGIAATIAAGWVLFGQRLNNKGWAGVILLVAGMVLIKLA